MALLGKAGLLLPAIVFFVVLIAGCAQQPPETPSPTPTAIPTVATPLPSPSPTPSPTPAFVPLKLEYELTTQMTDNAGQNKQQTIALNFFFEDERLCDGKKAWLGLLQAFDKASPQNKMWVKTTVYLEDGSFGSSQELSENELAFDSAVPKQSQLDIAFFMNSMFASVGENFVGNKVWTSEEPIVLKNAVSMGSSPDDISVFKKGNGTGSVPCTEFAVIGKHGGESTVCVTQPTEDNPLTYVVYAKPKEGQGFGWQLNKAGSQKSGVTRILQCMTPVKCAYVQMPSGEERAACEKQGKQMQEMRDDSGCVSKYECLSPGVRVKITAPDGSPVQNIELGITNAGSDNGPPLQTQRTNAQGIAMFNVGPGQYDVGFTTSSFPSQYSTPGKLRVNVQPGGTAQADFRLTAK